MKTLFGVFLMLSFLFAPFMCLADDSAGEPGDIWLLPGKRSGKHQPFKFPSSLFIDNGEVCLTTSYPYTYAIISVSDDKGDCYGSITVTYEEACSYLVLEPNSTITVTFDSGLILYGEY